MSEILWQGGVREVVIPDDFYPHWLVEEMEPGLVVLQLCDQYSRFPLAIADARLMTGQSFGALAREAMLLDYNPDFMQTLALPALASLSHESGRLQVRLEDAQESTSLRLDLGFADIDDVRAAERYSHFLTYVQRGRYFAAYARVSE